VELYDEEQEYISDKDYEPVMYQNEKNLNISQFDDNLSGKRSLEDQNLSQFEDQYLASNSRKLLKTEKGLIHSSSKITETYSVCNSGH